MPYLLRNAHCVLRVVSLTFLSLACLLLLASCRTASGAPYRPPTVAAQATPPPLPSSTPAPSPTPAETIYPTAVPVCTNGLTFLEDLTIPDGSLVQPGEVLDKRWQVQNSGTCNWDERYRLRLSSGPELGAPIEQALYPARAGSEATLRIVFIAPAEPGTYQSAWQAYDPQGNPFGDPIFIQVVVATTP